VPSFRTTSSFPTKDLSWRVDAATAAAQLLWTQVMVGTALLPLLVVPPLSMVTWQARLPVEVL
jgi:hypothetical protein